MKNNMVKRKSKRIAKRRKAYRRQPEPGEYGSFSIERLRLDLDADAMNAESAEARSKADGSVDVTDEPDEEDT